MRTKQIIVERKLGREQAAGQAFVEPGVSKKKKNLIEIDPRIEKHGKNLKNGTPKDYMDTVVHEAIHVCDPIMHEDDVASMANKITEVLWQLKFRKVIL